MEKTLGKAEGLRPDVADDAVEVRSKLIDHVEETLAKADDVPGHPLDRLIEIISVYIDTATELATVNMSPMEPPNSGPRLRDIM